ncbi:hypothetical protein BDN70DRAFT_950426, partial [Pholiota conissans]
SCSVQVDIDLPQIAVIGSQSSGKSSLIESISGIRLPRAAGTCTRCPMECRLSRNDEPWQCIVSLHFTTDSDGQPLGQARNERFGPIIYDKNEIEERIRRAQLAILTPKTSAKKFLSGDTNKRSTQLSFSLNAVTLQISGPDVADLSFCDLPGLIASVSSSDGSGKDDIALVENLVTTYIKKPSCIILLTVACETDFENQGAHRLAKKYDPEGKRTIGVLTKPDRIPAGEESSWLPFIRNEKEPLENNWFCVKQPSSSDLKLKLSWSEARKMEKNFFASKAPWCDLERNYQQYLRTNNLIGKLSSVLSDLISKRLPRIHKELEKSIEATRESLATLPRAPSGDPRSEIAALLHAFTTDLLRHVEGVPDDYGSSFGDGIGLIQAIRPAQERFKLTIRGTAPNFQPFERTEEGRRQLSPAEFLQNEESELMERASRARTRELPGIIPFAVQKTFIRSIIKEWSDPAQTLCKTVHTTVHTHIKHLVHKHFAEFGQGHLEKRVRSIMKRHMKECLERAEQKIKWLLELEDVPFSLNTHYLADYKSKFLAHYKGAREKYSRKDFVDAIQKYENPSKVAPSSAGFRKASGELNGIAKILSGLTEIGMTSVKPEDLAKLLPPDEMEPALVIMAEVRAYFQVAYKRFADVVPLAIDREIVRGAATDILRVLYDGLAVNGSEGEHICKELAGENDQIEGKRAELQNKLERLETASEELLMIGI